MSSTKLIPGPRSVALAALAAAALFAAGGEAHAAVPESAKELGGIRLGMTLDEVKAAAAARQPPLAITTRPAVVPGQAGKFFTRVASASKPVNRKDLFNGEDIDILFSPPPLPSRVVAIRRTLSFSQDKAPTQEYLQTSLREKFGGPPAPNLGPGTSNFLGWVWKPGGTPVGGSEASACIKAQDLWLNTYQSQPERFKDFKSGQTCDLVARASLDPRLVQISIFDYGALVDALMKAGAIEAADAKKKDDEAAAQAQKNRPKL